MAKTVSWVLGVVLAVAGLWGFISQPALGFITGSTLANIVNLVVGIVVLAMAGKSSAATTLKVVGIIYAVWGLLGVIGLGFADENNVTSWFYLVVGVVVAVLGWTSKSGAASPANPSSAPQA